MDRDQAMHILEEFTKTDSLRKHAMSVEAVMRAGARKYGGDEETWGIVGLLHDFDWEIHPDAERHPRDGAPLLRERGVPEDIIHAIQCHADYSGYEPRGPMDRAIYAYDELAGFVIACALVKPNRSLTELTVQSVRKKMKDKAFARQVNREDIVRGAERLGVDLDEQIGFVIEALKPVAEQIGLNQ